MKYVLLVFSMTFMFVGCSVKEINDNTNSITSDITNAFENSKDKSN